VSYKQVVSLRVNLFIAISFKNQFENQYFTLSQKLHISFIAFSCIREDCTFWNVVPDSAFTCFR